MAMNSTTVCAAPTQRSWAQVVHGDEKKCDHMSIKPATRGSLLRFCRGEVLSMLSNYGWLMVYGSVDHPAAEKHQGDVYIHKDDIVDGMSLYPGDIVNFFLYVDDEGLGAEMCHVEERAASDVDGITEVFSRISKVFASFEEDFDGDDSDDDAEQWHTEPWKSKRAPSSDGSTSDGATTDLEDTSSLGGSSDSEEELPTFVCKAKPCLEVPVKLNFRPPPGLDLMDYEDYSEPV